MYLEGNIIHSAVALTRNYNPALSVVTFNNNILPLPWTGPGSGNTVADPLLVDPLDVPTPTPRNYPQIAAQIRAQFALQQKSPARGTGPNGTDKGGVRPFGVSIGGAPKGITNQTNATLTVGTLMTGNGIPTSANAFPAGSGWTAYQWRLDGGAFSPEQPMTAPIVLNALSNGVHTVEVIGKNDAGFYQNRAEFGSDAQISRVTWTVDTNYIPPPPSTQIRLNEVLAKNSETQGFAGVFPDILELFNPSTAPVDLSGWGLTDNAALPLSTHFRQAPRSPRGISGGLCSGTATSRSRAPVWPKRWRRHNHAPPQCRGGWRNRRTHRVRCGNLPITRSAPESMGRGGLARPKFRRAKILAGLPPVDASGI